MFGVVRKLVQGNIRTDFHGPRRYSTCYPGSNSNFTNKIYFRSTDEIFPTYRVMNEEGIIVKEENDPKVRSNLLFFFFI